MRIVIESIYEQQILSMMNVLLDARSFYYCSSHYENSLPVYWVKSAIDV